MSNAPTSDSEPNGPAQTRARLAAIVSANQSPPSIDPKWTATWEIITPAIATEWLKHNTKNRNPNSYRRFVEDMKNGRWGVNGATISWCEDGTLIDGQNRLIAVEKSGVSIVALVVRGLPMEAQNTTDIGDRRQLGHQIHILGVPNASIVAGALRGRQQVLEWTAQSMSKRPYTVREGLDDLERIPGVAAIASRSVTWGNKTPGKTTASLMAACWLVIREVAGVDDAAVESFFARYHDLNVGNAVPESVTDPIWVLRETIAKQRGKLVAAQNVSPIWLAAVIIKAWNVHHDGAEVKLLKWGENEKFPRPH